MHQVRFANLRELLPADRGWVAEHYGPKVAGNVLLLEHQGRAPVRYVVPEGVAIPAARSGYRLTEADLAAGVAGITRDLRWRWWWAREASVVPLLLRSSDTISEGSGQHDSPVVLFDPRDRAGSVRRILDRAQQLRARDSMGLLLQRMVGAATRQSWGRYVWGEQLVSAVGETHNPYLPDEVLVAMASGLATQVVAPTAGFPINITAARDSGLISQVSNRAEGFLRLESMELDPVKFARQYVQTRRDVMALASGSYVSLPIDDAYVAALGQYALADGQLMPLPQSLALSYFRPRTRVDLLGTAAQALGPLPFLQESLLREWIDILRYFGNEADSLQFEGAHADPRAGGLSLFQSLPISLPAGWGAPLTIEGPDIVSTKVLGIVDCECPLLIFDSTPDDLTATIRSALREYDDAQAGRYYALYSMKQNGAVLDLSPHASIRLEFGGDARGGATSHVVTDLRLRMGRRGEVPRALAGGIVLWSAKELKQRANRQVGKLYFFDRAHIQSNGKELRVKIL